MTSKDNAAEKQPGQPGRETAPAPDGRVSGSASHSESDAYGRQGTGHGREGFDRQAGRLGDAPDRRWSAGERYADPQGHYGDFPSNYGGAREGGSAPGGQGGYGSHPDEPHGSYGGAAGGQGARQTEQARADESDLDPEYRRWREQQMRALDDDYRAWRGDRHRAFSDEFDQWRKNRSRD